MTYLKDAAVHWLAEHLTVIYSILQYTADTGQLEQPPQLEFPYPKITPEIHRPDPAAMERIFLHQAGPGVTVLRLAWQAGLTRSEIQSLQWHQINLSEQQLSLSDRQVPLQPELSSYLSALCQDRPSHEHVLLSRLNAPVSEPYVSMLARKLLSDYGMPEVRLIDLRHDYVIRLLETQTPDVVARWAGYRNARDVERLYREYLP